MLEPLKELGFLHEGIALLSRGQEKLMEHFDSNKAVSQNGVLSLINYPIAATSNFSDKAVTAKFFSR